MSKKNMIVKTLVDKWLIKKGNGLTLVKRLEVIKKELYLYRNGRTAGRTITRDLLSDDEEVMAALEHYFFARYHVAAANYSLNNMKVMILSYQLIKEHGPDVRHNKNIPTTPPSTFQKFWGERGADAGHRDLTARNLVNKSKGRPIEEPPLFRLPPTFTNYGT